MDLAKKKILLTGGTSGLGLEVARLLLSKGAEVWVMGRVLKDPISENARLRFIKTDFSDMSQLVRSLTDLLREDFCFDIVINNAGVLSPPGYIKTKDGFEYTFQVNFLSHLVINEMIMKRGAYNNPPTIIAVTSPVYRHVNPSFKIQGEVNYRSFRIYSESKYYMLLNGEILKKRFPGTNFMFLGFNPGTFGSGIYRMQKQWFHIIYRIASPFMRSPASVAQSLCRLIEQGDHEFNGIYPRNRFKPSFIQTNTSETDDFIEKCIEMVKGITSRL